MVFESVVVEVLNRFLGTYVENLDASQLKLGIWGGDVALNNLDIKDSALDDLDLPVKLKSGFLAKLTLKIPWKNLYTESVVAEVEGLFVLVVPNLGIKYDEAKERKANLDAKKAELARIEQAALQKSKAAAASTASEQADSFTEKLVAQIIRNLQIVIKNIHVRYEDQFTNKKRPFAVGFTLHEMFFQTTDENWKPTILKEVTKIIYKIVRLDCVSVYWNSHTSLVSVLEDKVRIREELEKGIAKADYRPVGYCYIINPISLEVKALLNLKPETDEPRFSIPKVDVILKLSSVCISVQKYQYQDVLEFLEAQERFALNAKYRKYRPNVMIYAGNSKTWWHFAYACVLNEEIRRKASNWSWDHIKEHRDLLKTYRNAWVDKLTVKKPSSDVLKQIEDAENKLDVFNLNIARQQAEIEVDRRGLKRVSEQGGWMSWVSGWWSSDTTNQQQPKDSTDVASQFRSAMSDEEKSKLFDAIGYQENQAPTLYPKEFVENNASFSLDTFKVIVRDDTRNDNVVMNMVMSSVSAAVQQRPSAQAIKFSLKVANFHISGLPNKMNKAPSILRRTAIVAADASAAAREATPPQLLMLFETHPLDDSCDQHVELKTQALDLVYDAATVNKLLNVFKPPESVRLRQLTDVAMAKYEEIKARSASGLEYALQRRTRLKVNVNISPTCLRIPEFGDLAIAQKMLMVDFGSFSVHSVEAKTISLDSAFYRKSEEEKLTELMSSVYDEFRIEFRSLAIMFADSVQHRGDELDIVSKVDLLRPTGLEVVIHKAAVVDLRFPSFPDVDMKISDTVLLHVLKLLLSIPQGEVEMTERTPEELVFETKVEIKQRFDKPSDIVIKEEDESAEGGEKAEDKLDTQRQVQLDLQFVLGKVSFEIQRCVNGTTVPYLRFSIRRIGADLKMKAFDMCFSAYIGIVELQYTETVGRRGVFYLIRKGLAEDTQRNLFSIEYTQADKHSPFFESEFHMMEQRAVINADPLILEVHQEALVDMQKFFLALFEEITRMKESQQKQEVMVKATTQLKRTLSVASLSAKSLKNAIISKRRKNLDDRLINMLMTANFEGVVIKIGTAMTQLCEVQVKGIQVNMTQKKKALNVVCSLKAMSITDADQHTLYKQILSVASKEVFRAEVTMFNYTDEEKAKRKLNEVDMNIVIRFAELRFVFLNLFVSRFSNWIAPFQAAAEKTASYAGTALQEGAKEAAEVLQKQEAMSLMKLDVMIQAPVVIVPQNSNSAAVLLANFGTITIANQFSSKTCNIGTSQYVLDEMRLNLTDLRFSRVLLENDSITTQAECLILEPVTFILSVSRNLAYSWYKEVPSISVSGNLPELKLSLSEEDYAVVMNTLSQNLSEVEPPLTTSKPVTPGAEHKTTEAIQAEKQAVEEPTLREVAVDLVGAGKPATTTSLAPVKGASDMIQFKFTIEKIATFLYAGPSNLSKGTIRRPANRSLAGLEFVVISLSGQIAEDGSIAADICLQNVTVNDLRVKSTGIRKFLSASDPNQSLIALSYAKNGASGTQNVKIFLSPVYVCLSPGFLMCLASFVSVKEDTAGAQAPKPKDVVKEEKLVKPETAAKTPEKLREVAPSGGAVSEMLILVRVLGFEVVLVEDCPVPENTQAIFLKLVSELHLKSVQDQTCIEASVTGLEMYSGYYVMDKRKLGKLQILKPCTLSLLYNMSSEADRGEIKFTALDIHVSPSTVRFLSGALAEMAKPQEETLGEETQIIERNLWRERKIGDTSFWFLSEVKEAAEAHETPTSPVVLDLVPGAEEPPSKEQQIQNNDSSPTPAHEFLRRKLFFAMEQLSVTLEVDGEGGATPLIYLLSSFRAEVEDWASSMSANAQITCEMSYFNENVSMWEPVLEPMLEDNRYRSWECRIMVESNSEEDIDGEEDFVTVLPKMNVIVTSNDLMEVTVTKSCLDMITRLLQAFTAAAKLTPPETASTTEFVAPFAFRNDTGLPVEILPSDDFEVEDRYKGSVVPDFVPVVLRPKFDREDIRTARSCDLHGRFLFLKFTSLNVVRKVDVSRAEKRHFSLPELSHPGVPWNVIADVTSHLSSKLVILCSVIQLVNDLPLDIEVYYKTDKYMELAGTATSGGRRMSLPLPAVYNPFSEIYFKPKDDKYDVSRESLNVRTLNPAVQSSFLIKCESSSESGEEFYVEVSVQHLQAYFENTNRKNVFTGLFTFFLRPALVFQNLLPHTVELSVGSFVRELKPGETVPLFCIHPTHSVLHLTVLSSQNLRSELKLATLSEELSVHPFKASSSINELNLGVRRNTRLGTTYLSLFCPVWMVNKTGLELTYKPTDIDPVRHVPNDKQPVLLSFSSKLFFAEKKIQMKVNDSELSDLFPIDTVGSAAKISVPKLNGSPYEVTINIQSTVSGLTKICTVSPFYVLDNHCDTCIEIKEQFDESNSWLAVEQGNCIGFWPKYNRLNQMSLMMRFKDTDDVSQPFPYSENFECFVMVPNKFIGVYVHVQISESNVVITFEKYEDGMTPVMIVNDTECFTVRFYQAGFDKKMHALKPCSFVHFYWESLLHGREFIWSCDTKENEKQSLSKDFASSFVSSKGTNVYWVSFLDGRQRVLLFTEDLAAATIAQQAYELERCDLQLTASFQGIGLSLVDNRVPAELAYVAIMSSGIIWEMKKKRFKAMSIKECRHLELAYAKYLNEREVGKNKALYVADKMTVDFEAMQQVKPHKREIRRSFQTGFWMQYKSSPHDMQLHVKINYFQIDNQLHGCVFSTVFSPFPLPKSVASESIPKPFVEVSLIVRTGEHTTIPHIEYFKVLVQEMALKADQGFVNAVLAFLTPESQSGFAESSSLDQDMLVVNQNLKAVAMISSSSGQKAFYNILHFSPIKLHLSYSQGGASTDINQAVPAFSSEFFGLLLKSVGVTVTEIQDVVFKLAYFEKESAFLSQSQLINDVVNHYVKQAVKQIYVLVLGLDVIGNPFGLIRDLSSGVETLFYEPIQGAIQGPEEFVEGLALGLRSLFGHTVGGAAGAVSRITGTLGKGIAALTMDEEYQKKRQQMMNRRQGDFKSGIVQGGRGLVMGVFEGVTGVFTKPVEGAKEEGALGFVKGLGKGLIGAVARPVSGAVDFASSSFEAVRKMTDVSTEVKHLRPSRFILPDKIVRPYMRSEAEGNVMLRDLEKGKYMNTDVYICHASLAKDNSSYFFVTDRRILFVVRNELMSSYSVEWEHVYSDFSPPTLEKNDIVVMLKEKRRKQLGIFGKSFNGRRITFMTEETTKLILSRLLEAYNKSQL